MNKKFFKKVYLVLLLSLLSFSCSMLMEEDSGNLVLDFSISSRYTSNTTPIKYTVVLYDSNNKEVDRSVVFGDKVEFKKLHKGDYEIKVTGFNKTYYFYDEESVEVIPGGVTNVDVDLKYKRADTMVIADPLKEGIELIIPVLEGNIDDLNLSVTCHNKTKGTTSEIFVNTLRYPIINEFVNEGDVYSFTASYDLPDISTIEFVSEEVKAIGGRGDITLTSSPKSTYDYASSIMTFTTPISIKNDLRRKSGEKPFEIQKTLVYNSDVPDPVRVDIVDEYKVDFTTAQSFDNTIYDVPLGNPEISIFINSDSNYVYSLSVPSSLLSDIPQEIRIKKPFLINANTNPSDGVHLSIDTYPPNTKYVRFTKTDRENTYEDVFTVNVPPDGGAVTYVDEYVSIFSTYLYTGEFITDSEITGQVSLGKTKQERANAGGGKTELLFPDGVTVNMEGVMMNFSPNPIEPITSKLSNSHSDQPVEICASYKEPTSGDIITGSTSNGTIDWYTAIGVDNEAFGKDLSLVSVSINIGSTTPLYSRTYTAEVIKQKGIIQNMPTTINIPQ